MRTAVRLLAQSADQGALPGLYVAVADVPGNSFAGPEPSGAHARGAELTRPLGCGEDAELARRLWDASERMTGVTWPALAG